MTNVKNDFAELVAQAKTSARLSASSTSTRRQMQRLVAGLTVAYVATFDLNTCAVSGDTFRVLDVTNVEIYDQIPPRKNGPDR